MVGKPVCYLQSRALGLKTALSQVVRAGLEPGSSGLQVWCPNLLQRLGPHTKSGISSPRINWTQGFWQARGYEYICIQYYLYNDTIANNRCGKIIKGADILFFQIFQFVFGGPNQT